MRRAYHDVAPAASRGHSGGEFALCLSLLPSCERPLGTASLEWPHVPRSLADDLSIVFGARPSRPASAPVSVLHIVVRPSIRSRSLRHVATPLGGAVR